MIKVRFINETSYNIREELISKCVAETVESCEKKEYFSCTVVIVSSDKIKDLNKTYREKDLATDVLSFPAEADALVSEDAEEEKYNGEIFICPEFIKDKTQDSKFEWELCHVAVHGTFHLLGIHHEELEGGHKEIHKKEIKIINKILKLRS